jgi:cell division protein FtsL
MLDGVENYVVAAVVFLVIIMLYFFYATWSASSETAKMKEKISKLVDDINDT